MSKGFRQAKSEAESLLRIVTIGSSPGGGRTKIVRKELSLRTQQPTWNEKDRPSVPGWGKVILDIIKYSLYSINNIDQLII